VFLLFRKRAGKTKSVCRPAINAQISDAPLAFFR